MKTTTVSLSGPNNSQLFCDHCGNAVCRDESICSRCKRKVEPEDYQSRWSQAFNRSKKGIWCKGRL